MADPATQHLAQFNLARLRHGPNDPRLVGFAAGANMIKKAASATPGHVWNEQDVIDESYFATRSVWASLEALETFVYSGIHHRYLKRRLTWFVEDARPNMVLWHVGEGEFPTLAAAGERLDDLRENGPSERAFDFATASTFVITHDASY